MRLRSKGVVAAMAASAVLVPVTSSIALAASANGAMFTSEFYNAQAGHEVVTIVGVEWANQKSLAYTIENRKTKAVVASANLPLQYGFGVTQNTSLACGKYELSFNHIDGTPGTVDFAVTDDGTCH